MNRSPTVRWAVLIAVVACAAIAAGAVAIGLLLAALDAGYLRGPLVHFLAVRAGREIRIDGVLEVSLFTLHPRLTAERVTIGNPPWVPAGTTAEIAKVSLALQTPRFGQLFAVSAIELEGAKLYLARNSEHYANWQLTNPDEKQAADLPIIRSLSMPNAHVLLDDARRHLKFDGTVSVQGAPGAAGGPVLQITAAGQLNGRAASLEIAGDALAVAAHDRPYHFTFAERSSGSRINGRGILLRAFDFNYLDTTFDAAGEDLADLYFLTGVTLMNTGGFHLSGQLARRGTNTKFSNLLATSGQSDMRGTVSIESSGGQPKLDADLNSQVLHLADLGLRAAGRAPLDPAAPHLLLSDAALKPGALRHRVAVIAFQARRVDVGSVPLHSVTAKATIERNVLQVESLLADVLEGKLSARLRLDATTDDPAADVDLSVSDAQIGEFFAKNKRQPPIEGPLQARVTVTGRGASVHQIAASANGSVTALLPSGAMRASLAELSGADLRGLGLFLGKSTQEAPIRCAVASFQARDGTLSAQNLVLDTDPVLITGNGQIHLDSEALDLTLSGQPKSMRLFRMHSPVVLHGTLAHPSAAIRPGVLAIVDRGSGRNVDCAALLAAAKAHETREPHGLRR